jgi:hypothetical protein
VAVVKNCTELYLVYFNTYFRLPLTQPHILKVPKRIGMKACSVLSVKASLFKLHPFVFLIRLPLTMRVKYGELEE